MRTKLTAVACAHAAGTVFLLAAPGNFVRSDALPPSPPLDRIAGVVAAMGSLFDGYTVAVAIVVALPFVLREQRLRAWFAPWSNATRRPADVAPQHRHGGMFLILALVYMGLLLGVPRSALAARITFPASVFLCCYAASLFQSRPQSPLLNRLMLCTVTLLTALQCVIVLPDLARVAQVDRRWTETLRPLVGSGADATVPLVRFNGRTLRVHKYFFFAGITPDPTYFINVCYAKAKGLRTITAR